MVRRGAERAGLHKDSDKGAPNPTRLPAKKTRRLTAPHRRPRRSASRPRRPHRTQSVRTWVPTPSVGTSGNPISAAMSSTIAPAPMRWTGLSGWYQGSKPGTWWSRKGCLGCYGGRRGMVARGTSSTASRKAFVGG